MATLKLVLTDLQVESFTTAAEDGRAGTVHAHVPDDAPPAKCTYDRHTCTCPVFPSCAGNETCLYTECVSCPVPVATVAGGVDAAEPA
ncbi:MAG TPA: pinensin family lanthipeptide [Longimicrobium sp.]|nr:pinensin family lanthipeptide [Longimicrobium sp.]